MSLRFAAVVILALGGVLGASLLASAPERPNAAWTEVAWPFPADPWGRGRAFRCKAADCGAEVSLYVRAKLGFCNCVTGIADDDALDSMGDLALLGAEAAPLGGGRAIEVGWMKGRARTYAAQDGRAVVSAAFNDRCDMVVATAVLGQATPLVESRVVELLNSAQMLDWTKARFGI